MSVAKKINDKIYELDFGQVIPKPNQYIESKSEFDQVMEMLIQIHNKLPEEKNVLEVRDNGYTSEEESIKIENNRLYKEIELMKHKLNYSIPIPSIIYIVITSITLGGSMLALFLQLTGQLIAWDIRYSLGGVIVSLGLLVTAVISLKDWKEFLDGEKE